MRKNIFHGDPCCLLRCRFGSLDQLCGLRRGQLRSFMVDKTWNRIAGRQQLDAATERHPESTGFSCNRNQSCPTCVQPESERGGRGHAWKSKTWRECAQVGRT
jgi:hypothetical protein